MCAQIRHRGPDDEGFHVGDRCAIGMRRLSIIDLATGHQPISNEDGTVWVVFNGEIYNYQELRQDLMRRGHRFATNSDTETLIHLYEEEGVDGIQRLRGMFAYAIWDERTRKLTLVRDRFGKKPLYYAHTAGGFYFASELKCIRKVTGPFDIDEQAIRLYLQFGYIPDPWSPYRQIKKVPAGCWMQIEANGTNGETRQGRYWSAPEPLAGNAGTLSEQEAMEEIRRVFDESVRMRMISDVPLGAFLSGGIDSSLVVASMARQSEAPIRTFSIGWDENAYNELPYARMVAREFATDHQEFIVKPDAVELLPRLVRCFDEPFADGSAIPTYLVSQCAAQSVKVVLSGDGGDELFGGYHSFFMTEKYRYADRLPGACRHLFSLVADAMPYSAYGKNYLRAISRPNAIERYMEFGCFSSYYGREQVIEPAWRLPTEAAYLRQVFNGAILPDSRDCLSQAMHFEMTAKLTGDILTKVDRMSMANSLEVRCPLLDHKLAELSARIPNVWKTRDGKGKLILLKALGDRLPPELLTRNKMGFGIPLPEWLRGPLRPMLRDHLLSKRFLERGIASRSGVEALLTEHDAKQRDHSAFLWLLLALELWFVEQAF